MRKKRVLILSEGFGAGHTQAAHSLSTGLRQLSSSVQTRVLELGSFLHPMIAPFIFSAYRKTITSKPGLYAKLYRSQYAKSLNPLTQLALHRIFYSQTAAVIGQLRPDAVVCTHPFPNVVVSRLIRSRSLTLPLYTVITDYDAHGTWISPEVDKYLVSTPEVRDKLLDRFIPDRNIEVTGIPIHPKFWRKHDREALRAEFGLKPMPTVLVMGGGWGLIDNMDMLRLIAGWRERVQLIVLCGNNGKTMARLSSDERFRHPNIHLLGFTKDVDKLMEISHLLISKPGGMTCTEAMAKRLPMLLHSPIPGQEEENCKYFTERGLGREIVSLHTVEQAIRQMIAQFGELERSRAAAVRESEDSSLMRCPHAILEMVM